MTVFVKNNRHEALAGDITFLGTLIVDADAPEPEFHNAITVSLPSVNSSHNGLLAVKVGENTLYIKLFPAA